MLVHAGPFANIAHGNSSIIADRVSYHGYHSYLSYFVTLVSLVTIADRVCYHGYHSYLSYFVTLVTIADRDFVTSNSLFTVYLKLPCNPIS